MIGDDAMAGHIVAGRGCAGEFDRSRDQVAEEIDVVIVVHALQHGGDALKPHAGVDRRPRQRLAPSARELLILHEDEIPDLDETVAVFVRRTRRAARNVIAVVVEDLRARTAGTRVAHRPEIGRGRDADDFRVRQACDLLPEVEGFVVFGIDGDEKAVFRKREFARDEIPGEGDRVVLEIVAEGEIPQHLEEGVVARGIADIVEVVVLAAGAHAFLRRGRAGVGALLLAGEDVLELHHAGIGEEQGGIVARHKRRRRDDGVVARVKEIEEGRADIVQAFHGSLVAFTAKPCPERGLERRYGCGSAGF